MRLIWIMWQMRSMKLSYCFLKIKQVAHAEMDKWNNKYNKYKLLKF